MALDLDFVEEQATAMDELVAHLRTNPGLEVVTAQQMGRQTPQEVFDETVELVAITMENMNRYIRELVKELREARTGRNGS